MKGCGEDEKKERSRNQERIYTEKECGRKEPGRRKSLGGTIPVAFTYKEITVMRYFRFIKKVIFVMPNMSQLFCLCGILQDYQKSLLRSYSSNKK
jgi:hypothetical protein